MMDYKIVILILVVGIATYAFRLLGFYVSHRQNFSNKISRFIDNIPGFMVAAIVGVSISGSGYVFIIGAIGTIVSMYITNNLIASITLGCVTVYIVRTQLVGF